MISKDVYLTNPCGTYSIPYAKMKTYNKPDNIDIFHHSAISLDQLKSYYVQTFFRLKHNLTNIKEPLIAISLINFQDDQDELVSMINQCYQHENICIDKQDLIKLISTNSYDASLWLKIVDQNQIVGSIIGCIDDEMKEGWIEWVQVLPSYQSRGYGQALINALLVKMKDKASFVTVSGNAQNKKDPEKVYRICGFTGNDYWYICKK